MPCQHEAASSFEKDVQDMKLEKTQKESVDCHRTLMCIVLVPNLCDFLDGRGEVFGHVCPDMEKAVRISQT